MTQQPPELDPQSRDAAEDANVLDAAEKAGGQTAITQIDGAGNPVLSDARALHNFAKYISQSIALPKYLHNNPALIATVYMKLQQLGLNALAGFSKTYYNERTGTIDFYTDLIVAACRRHPDFVSLEDICMGRNSKGEIVRYGIDTFLDFAATGAVCIVQRKGQPPFIDGFTLKEAQNAKLARASGPWETYTRRMLMHRARSFACRNAFQDALFCISDDSFGVGEPDDGRDQELVSPAHRHRVIVDARAQPAERKPIRPVVTQAAADGAAPVDGELGEDEPMRERDPQRLKAVETFWAQHQPPKKNKAERQTPDVDHDKNHAEKAPADEPRGV